MEILRNSKSSSKALFDDEKMFEFIFKAYFPRLKAFARKFIPEEDTAEDIIQEVFMKIWVKRKEIMEDTFQTYLFTLVRNACLNYVKHRQIVDSHQAKMLDTSKAESLFYADFFSDPYHKTIFNEIQGEIEKAMQELPEQTRKIFQLSRFEGLKNSEIAKILHISLRTVEKHNTRALERLKAHLSVHYFYAIAVLDLIKELKK